MKVCNVYVERKKDSFLKLTVIVKPSWWQRKRYFITYKLSTKLRRNWFTKEGKAISDKLSSNLTNALNVYIGRGGDINKI